LNVIYFTLDNRFSRSGGLENALAAAAARVYRLLFYIFIFTTYYVIRVLNELTDVCVRVLLLYVQQALSSYYGRATRAHCCLIIVG